MAERPLAEWADRLEIVCAACPRLGVRQVRVLAETGSTQDAAWRACARVPGWLVVAGRQVGGRGRLGREWADTGDKGLAMTLVLPAGAVSSVGVGVAVCRAVERCVGGSAARGADCWPRRIGLRWPNDVVERTGGKKVAGVLIEARAGAALVGIGVNVDQEPGDYPAALRGRAVSVGELGGKAGRLRMACEILRELERVVQLDAHAIAHEAIAMDTIVGTVRRLVCDGREYRGEVVALGADGSIDVAMDDGRVVSLPAATTSLVHE